MSTKLVLIKALGSKLKPPGVSLIFPICIDKKPKELELIVPHLFEEKRGI
jgi:hypothetical protein